MKNYFINDNNCKLFGVRSGIANTAKRGDKGKVGYEGDRSAKPIEQGVDNKKAP